MAAVLGEAARLGLLVAVFAAGVGAVGWLHASGRWDSRRWRKRNETDRGKKDRG